MRDSFNIHREFYGVNNLTRENFLEEWVGVS